MQSISAGNSQASTIPGSDGMIPCGHRRYRIRPLSAKVAYVKIKKNGAGAMAACEAYAKVLHWVPFY